MSDNVKLTDELRRLVVRAEEEITGEYMGEPSADAQQAFDELVRLIRAATPEAGPTDAKSADSELLDTIAHVAKGYASNECADRIMRLLRKREGGYPSVSLSRIYFEIAATVIGEAEVRRQRDEIIAGGSMETTGLASKEEAR